MKNITKIDGNDNYNNKLFPSTHIPVTSPRHTHTSKPPSRHTHTLKPPSRHTHIPKPSFFYRGFFALILYTNEESYVSLKDYAFNTVNKLLDKFNIKTNDNM